MAVKHPKDTPTHKKRKSFPKVDSNVAHSFDKDLADCAHHEHSETTKFLLSVCSAPVLGDFDH